LNEYRKKTRGWRIDNAKDGPITSQTGAADHVMEEWRTITGLSSAEKSGSERRRRLPKQSLIKNNLVKQTRDKTAQWSHWLHQS